MQVPIPTQPSKSPNFEWREISEIKCKDYDDMVYSLSVDKYEHYIADGIITHNCLYGWKNGAGHYFTKDRKQTTVFEDKIDLDKLSKDELKDMIKDILADKLPVTVIHEDKPLRSDLHPTMKPIKLIARLINNSSKRGENVIDFFGGSGSTLIACEQLNRTCYTMELDPKFVDVIINRWEQLTGEKAVKINE